MTKRETDRIITIMNKGFRAVDRRFEGIDKRFEAIDKRFEAMEESTNERFKAMLTYVDGRFDEVLTKEEWRKEWSQHMALMDNIMMELSEIRQQRLFSGEQGVRIESTVRDHEKRIKKLEKAAA